MTSNQSTPKVDEATINRLTAVDDFLIESLERSYVLSMEVHKLYEEQDRLSVALMAGRLLAEYPSVNIMRIGFDDYNNLKAIAVLDGEDSPLLEGEELNDFVVLEGSATVKSILQTFDDHKTAEWIYDVTAEPEIYSDRNITIHLKVLDVPYFDIDLNKANNLISPETYQPYIPNITLP